MSEQPSSNQSFYRVDVAVGKEGCLYCGHDAYYTITYEDEGERVEIGTSWSDQECAQDICDLMNMAYDAGREADPAVNAEEAKLVAFFRSKDGDVLGRGGDWDNLSPAETAIRAMRELMMLRKRNER